MKLILTSLMFIMSITCYNQGVDIKMTKTEKILIAAGTSTTVYGFAKKGFEKKDIAICVGGMLLAGSTAFIKEKKERRVCFTGNGIKIKLNKKRKK